MAFEAKTFSEVFTAMRQRAEAGGAITDFEVGSAARTLTESFSYEIALLYEQMRLVYLSAFVDTAEGPQLDLVVSILGVTRSEPDFASGVVTFQRDVGNEDVNIPFGTLVATADTPAAPKKVYRTVEPKTLPKDQTSTDVRVQALNRGEAEVVPAGAITVMPRPIPSIKSVVNAEATVFTGKRRETDDELRERAKNSLISSGKASVIAIENALLSLPGVRDVRVLENFTEEKGHGMIEVFVDGIDFGVPSEVRRVRDTLDSVRAAGIFAQLKPATPLEVDGVFRIEINPNLKLSTEERAAFEGRVRAQIESYIESLKMGDPLLLSQITRSVLSVSGVNDLTHSTMSITRRVSPPTQFNPSTDRVAPSERFKAKMICVASEDKPLPVDIEFRANAGLNAASYDKVLAALNASFLGLTAGNPVDVDIAKLARENGITVVPGTLVIKTRPWCGSIQVTENKIPVRFVERAVLGDVLAYQSVLKITGALRLRLPASVTEEAKQSTLDAVRQKLEAYLKDRPGTDVVFREMADLARTVNPVQTAEVDASDFRVRLNDDLQPLPARVGAEKIEVEAFEKAELEHFCIASSTQAIDVTITKVSVQVTVLEGTPNGDALKQRIKDGIAGKELLSNLETGEDLRYDVVQDALEALIPGTSYTVTTFEMKGVSQCDGRSQILTGAGTVLHVRTVEIAIVKPIEASAITVNVTVAKLNKP